MIDFSNTIYQIEIRKIFIITIYKCESIINYVLNQIDKLFKIMNAGLRLFINIFYNKYKKKYVLNTFLIRISAIYNVYLSCSLSHLFLL